MLECTENQYGSSTFSNSPLITFSLPSRNIPPAPPQGGSCRMVSIREEYWMLEYAENQYGSSIFSNSPLEGG